MAVAVPIASSVAAPTPPASLEQAVQQIRQLRSQLAQQTEENTLLRGMHNELKSSYMAVSVDAAEHEKVKEELVKIKALAAQYVQKAKKEAALYKDEIAALKADVAQRTAVEQAQKDQIAALTANGASVSSTANGGADADTALAAVRSELSSLAKAAEEEKTRLTTELAKKSALVKKAQDEYLRRLSMIEEMKREAAERDNKAADEIRRLTAQVDSAQSQLDEANNQLRLNKHDIERITTEHALVIAQQNDRMSALQRQVDDKHNMSASQLEQANKLVALQTTELTELKRERSQLQSRLDSSEKQLKSVREQLNAELAKAADENKSLKRDLDVEREKRAAEEREFAAERERFIAAESTAKENAESEKKALQQTVTSLQSRLSQSEKTDAANRAQFVAEVRGWEEQLKMLKPASAQPSDTPEEMTALRRRLAHLEQSEALWLSEKQASDARIVELQGGIDNLRKQSESSSKSNNELVSDLRRQISAQSKELLSLKRQMEVAIASGDEAAALVTRLRQQISERDAAVDTLEKELAEVNQREIQHLDDLKSIKFQLDNVLEQQQRLQTAYQTAQTRAEEAEQRAKAVETKLSTSKLEADEKLSGAAHQTALTEKKYTEATERQSRLKAQLDEALADRQSAT